MTLPSKVKAVLWDVDGTLFSAEDILAPAYKKAFYDFYKKDFYKGDFQKKENQKKQNKTIPIPTQEQILEEVGKPVKEIFQNLAPSLTPKEQDELSRKVLFNLVKQITFGGGKYYEKMPEILRELYQKGCLQFSASNGRYPYVESILRMSKTFDYFQEVQALDNKEIKNKTDLVRYTLKRHSLKAKETILIGDRASDREAADANGIAFIAAAYGHGKAAEWKNAALIIHSLQELRGIVWS